MSKFRNIHFTFFGKNAELRFVTDSTITNIGFNLTVTSVHKGKYYDMILYSGAKFEVSYVSQPSDGNRNLQDSTQKHYESSAVINCHR